MQDIRENLRKTGDWSIYISSYANSENKIIMGFFISFLMSLLSLSEGENEKDFFRPSKNSQSLNKNYIHELYKSYFLFYHLKKIGKIK